MFGVREEDLLKGAVASNKKEFDAVEFRDRDAATYLESKKYGGCSR